jgi:hypothetical protein
MHDWMMEGWGMGFGFIFWLVILAVVIAGIVWWKNTDDDEPHRAIPRALLLCKK